MRAVSHRVSQLCNGLTLARYSACVLDMVMAGEHAALECMHQRNVPQLCSPSPLNAA